MNRKMLAGSALATVLVAPAAAFLTLGVLQDRIATFEPSIPVVADKSASKGIVAQNDLALPQQKKMKPFGKTERASEPMEQSDPQTAQEDVVANAPTPKPSAQQDAAQEVAADLKKPSKTQQSDFSASEITGLLNTPSLASPNYKSAARRSTSAALAPPDAVATMLPESNADVRSRADMQDNDRFTSTDINPVKSVASDSVSTFSVDVDTASYAYARSQIMGGRLPQPDSVRVEEMVNYFPYDWKGPDRPDTPFRANVTVMPAPWNAGTQLMHIGIKGYDINATDEKPANLVFLIDVSGSMAAADKLPLLKSAFRLLVNTLRPTDTVSIVVYAGASGIALEPTRAADRQKILAAIDTLTPGGSTAGAEGLETAYQLAEKGFVKDGVNRIFLATDGDFNVGLSSDAALKSLIKQKRKSGVFLSVLGFGAGNYNDGLMQALAQNGNGVAAYIDTLAEAEKTLVQEAKSSIFPIAKDVKIQVEFNPDKIAEYRLIGYETRALQRQDFNNDRVDAGEIGSGHEVTAIYEITPKGSPAVLNDDLRYGTANGAQPPKSDAPASKADADELAFVKIRYKQPDEDRSQLITMPVLAQNALTNIGMAPTDVRFSLAVAAFAQKLKGEGALSPFGWDEIVSMAQNAKGADPFGYRAEFIKLVALVKSLEMQ